MNKSIFNNEYFYKGILLIPIFIYFILRIHLTIEIIFPLFIISSIISSVFAYKKSKGEFYLSLFPLAVIIVVYIMILIY
ncbi:hypothetical protein MASR1M29_22440 [Cloacibacterium normanense]